MLSEFVTQICIFYQKHTGCPYHTVMNDVDIEDICDYFIFIIEDDKRKKQKAMMEKFQEL